MCPLSSDGYCFKNTTEEKSWILQIGKFSTQQSNFSENIIATGLQKTRLPSSHYSVLTIKGILSCKAVHWSI